MLLALLLACGEPPELVCRPGYEAVDGECIQPAAEQCGDGVDNDADGLLDCEDDDCLGSSNCAERACSDGADEDGDGLTDCADADCWGAPACTVAVQLLDARASRLTVIKLADQFGTAAGCEQTWVASSYAELALTSVTGEIAITGGGGEPTTCTWTADRSFVRFDHADGPDAYFEDAWPVTRSGVALSQDCPLRSSDFLPPSFFFDRTADGDFLHAGRNRTAPLWAGVPAGQAPASVTTDEVISASYGDPCDIQYIQTLTEAEGFSVVPGSSPYLVTAPE